MVSSVVMPGGMNMHEVLVVDERTEVREAIADSLRFEGYTVREAATTDDGLRLARELRPGLVLAELQMPRWSGLALISAIRTDPGTRGIPVIAMTTLPKEKIPLPGPILRKPFQLDVLLGAVQLHGRWPPRLCIGAA